MELSPGTEFAGHRIDAVAGRGGMGVVYRATHLALDRVVALKLIASALVLATGSAVAVAAGSAPAHTRSDMIVCPLEPNDTVTTPCCGPPIVTAVIYPP